MDRGASWWPAWPAGRLVRLAGSLALGTGLLWVAFRGVDIDRLGHGIEAVQLRWVVAAISLDLGVFLAKAFKWRLVVAPLRRLPVSTFLSGIAVGALAGSVLPFRLDELVRALYLARRSDLPRSTVLGTIVVERAIDVSLLLGVVMFVLAAFGRHAWVVRGGLVLAAALVGVGALVWLSLRGGGDAARPRHILRARARDTLIRWMTELRRGLATLPRGARLAQALMLGGLEWCLTVAYLMCALAAFGVSLSPQWGLFLGAATYLGFALPTGPSGLGGFELLVKGVLAGGLGIDPSRSLGIALALHLLLVMPISVLGASCVVREGGGRVVMRQAWEERGGGRIG